MANSLRAPVTEGGIGVTDSHSGSGADADRTRYLVHAMDALYQLSYSPVLPADDSRAGWNVDSPSPSAANTCSQRYACPVTITTGKMALISTMASHG